MGRLSNSGFRGFRLIGFRVHGLGFRDNLWYSKGS